MQRKLSLRRFVGGDPGKQQTTKDGDYSPTSTERVDKLDDAQLVSSRLIANDGHELSKDHVIAIDVDMPCHLIETSPGKHHLVIERVLSWPKYRALLVALEAAGVIETGYLEASLARGASYLRIHDDTPLDFDDGVQPYDSEPFIVSADDWWPEAGLGRRPERML